MAKNSDVMTGGMWCSTPDKDGNVECIPFNQYIKMSQKEKDHFNRERAKDDDQKNWSSSDLPSKKLFKLIEKKVYKHEKHGIIVL